MRVGLAVGSNLGDRLGHLRTARAAVLALPGVDGTRCLSAPVYETVPVGCPPDASRFLNSVFEIEAVCEPAALLASLLGIEAAAGRVRRSGEANASRPLDLDILYAGERTVRTRDLVLPHPRMCQRRFVLAPLAAIRPDLILPGQTRAVAEILAALDDDPAEVALALEQW